MDHESYNFVPPEECPVFHPTIEEFKDPLLYIEKIRPIGEKAGICKIVPPPSWQPPFAVDVDNFKFTPRIQRLNELEASTRVKLNFLDQIARFWELQGSSLKIPAVEKRAVDLYSLHKIVKEEGGFKIVEREKKWSKVASKMGYSSSKQVGLVLRTHYDLILFPYDVFQMGKSVDDFVNEDNVKSEDNVLEKEKNYVPHGIPSRQAIKPPCDRSNRRSKRHMSDLNDEFESTESKELKRLKFYGAGPKMAGYHTAKKNAWEAGMNGKGKGKGKKNAIGFYEEDPLAKYVCHNCDRGDDEESMLLCDGCDDSYHTFCLKPPLTEIPQGDWRCPKCLAKEVSKPLEAFGFEQAQREYTLQSFGEMADKFKSDYFNMPVHLVPTEMVEKEYWRILFSVDEDVTVEYGADLHTMDHGSGFPTKKAGSLTSTDEVYVKCGWNLNNLPVAPGSVLRHINGDISGMMVPWMYVGMCFATFCWHNEDHWSYSINYLHWGEPKTWYAAPGSKAELFEEAMKESVPELFDSQPDLLHQLVTIMNPNMFSKRGVPIFRTDQKAGEFVITFPRAYHSGFNQGFNFAEAVNFAPPDWLSMGRECIEHYSNLHRFCVFSHDELVCKMSTIPDELDVIVAANTYQDMLKMVNLEKKLRKHALDWGLTAAIRVPFELFQDDERQCEFCKTTVFLSAVTCSCTNNLVCLRHFKDLCSCPPSKHVLKFKYTLDELPPLLLNLKGYAESFEPWAQQAKEALSATDDERLGLQEFKKLIEDAEQKKLPRSELLLTLKQVVEDAEKCILVAQQLEVNKVRTRNRQVSEPPRTGLTVEELHMFYEQMKQLPCVIKEANIVKELLRKVDEFTRTADILIKEGVEDLEKLKACLDLKDGIQVTVDQYEIIRERYAQAEWYHQVDEIISSPHLITIENLKKQFETGIKLPAHPKLENKLCKLKECLDKAEEWEKKIGVILDPSHEADIAGMEKILQETEELNINLSCINNLREVYKKVKESISRYEYLQSMKYYPFLEDLENLVSKGKSLPVKLPFLATLEKTVAESRLWREKIVTTFLKKNSYFSLLEILCPRIKYDESLITNKTKRHRYGDDVVTRYHLSELLGIDVTDNVDSDVIKAAYQKFEESERITMKRIRSANISKKEGDGGEAKYCICGSPYKGFMLQCELCKNWYHSICITLPKLNQKSTENGLQFPSNFEEYKYLCVRCMRSRRPKLDSIMCLLLSLENLKVRLPEGEVLQRLIERAVCWKNKVRQALKGEECISAMSKISNMSQVRLKSLAPESKKPNLLEVKVTEIESDAQNNQIGNSDVPPGDEPISNGEIGTPNKVKQPRKTPLVPRHLDPPLVSLSAPTKALLEDLMFEGDLMDISFQESITLWRILQSSRPNKYEQLPDMEELEEMAKMEKLQARKDKSRRDEDKQRKMNVKKRKAEDGLEKENTKKAKMMNKDGKTEPRKPGKVKEKHGKNGVSRGMMNGADGDSDELCASKSCCKPIGDEVDWVQCDGGCEEWFHLVCVGLNKQDVREDEDYICPSCKKKANSNNPLFEGLVTTAVNQTKSQPSPNVVSNSDNPTPLLLAAKDLKVECNYVGNNVGFNGASVSENKEEQSSDDDIEVIEVIPPKKPCIQGAQSQNETPGISFRASSTPDNLVLPHSMECS